MNWARFQKSTDTLVGINRVQRTYTQRTYTQHTYTQHTYTQRTYTQRTYTQHTYTQRTYTQRTYTQRTYTQRTYTQHTYTQHTYTQRTYTQRLPTNSDSPSLIFADARRNILLPTPCCRLHLTISNAHARNAYQCTPCNLIWFVPMPVETYYCRLPAAKSTWAGANLIQGTCAHRLPIYSKLPNLISSDACPNIIGDSLLQITLERVLI